MTNKYPGHIAICESCGIWITNEDRMIEIFEMKFHEACAREDGWIID